MAVTSFSRNGATQRAGSFPKQPLLLAPVILPFQGPGYSDAGPITILYNVPCVREIVEEATQRDGILGLFADLQERQDAIVAQDVPLLDKARQIDGLVLEGAHRLIQQAVYAVEWPYTDDPPDPQRPETFDIWDARVVAWIAYDGLGLAGQQYAGPLAMRIPGRS